MEDPCSKGISDIVLVLDSLNYVVFELKYEKNKGQKNPLAVLNRLAKKALRSIKEKEYGKKHRFMGNNIVTVGVGVLDVGQGKAVFGGD
jgi:hypothetical protein